MDFNYSVLIDEFAENINLNKHKFWKTSLNKIDDSTISSMTNSIKEKQLSGEQLQRMLAISESIKKENDASVMFSEFAVVLATFFAVHSLIISAATPTENNDAVFNFTPIITLFILLSLIIYLVYVLRKHYRMKNNEVKINCIQISIKELIDQKKGNQFKIDERFSKRFQDFRNQDSKLMHEIEAIEKNRINNVLDLLKL